MRTSEAMSSPCIVVTTLAVVMGWRRHRNGVAALRKTLTLTLYYRRYLTLCSIYSIVRIMKHIIHPYRATIKAKKYEQLQIP